MLEFNTSHLILSIKSSFLKNNAQKKETFNLLNFYKNCVKKSFNTNSIFYQTKIALNGVGFKTFFIQKFNFKFIYMFHKILNEKLRTKINKQKTKNKKRRKFQV